jgi:hypothetical protein
MKTIYLIVLFTSLGFSQPEFLDIKFYDSSQQEFHSLSLKTEIDILYKFNSKPYLLLYITRSLSNPLYKQQLKNLNDIDAEQLQVLYVEPNAENINEDMYHTDKNTALNLLEKENDFKIMLLDGKGKILFVSTKAITEKELEQVLRK